MRCGFALVLGLLCEVYGSWRSHYETVVQSPL